MADETREPTVELDATAEISPYESPDRYDAARRRAAAEWDEMDAALRERDDRGY